MRYEGCQHRSITRRDFKCGRGKHQEAGTLEYADTVIKHLPQTICTIRPGMASGAHAQAVEQPRLHFLLFAHNSQSIFWGRA